MFRVPRVAALPEQDIGHPAALRQVPIVPLVSTSDVFVPPRGRSFDKFSFDFPEPSVAFGGLRFGFRVFTYENAYGLDATTESALLRIAPSRITPGSLSSATWETTCVAFFVSTRAL